MLNAGHSAHTIASIILLVSMPLPSLDFTPKSVLGSRRSHLVVIQKSFPLPMSIMLSIFITLRKAENAVQITKTLSNITNQSLSPSTVCLYLKKS
jgi:hypothetical protein